jgi:acyl carrier protein
VDPIPILKGYLVEELAAAPADLENLDTRLVEDDIIDSLGIFSLVDFIEERFQVTIEPTDITIENFGTLRAMGDLVTEKLSAPRA